MQKITLKARVDSDVVERLALIATKETRSMSSLVAKILKEYVERKLSSKAPDNHLSILLAAVDAEVAQWGKLDAGADKEEGKKC